MSGTFSPSVLPQTRVARLLTAVRHGDATSIHAIGTIPGAHPLVVGHRAPALLAIELGAQAAAAMVALGSPGASTPVRGRLVRVKTATFVVPTLPVDTPIDVTARRIAAADPLAIYEIAVLVGDVPHVTATLSTYGLPPQLTE